MKEIQLNHGYVALVDDEDFERLSKWKWVYADGRAVRYDSRSKKTIYMHRVIIDTPDGMYTDHIKTGDTLNNQKSNLRVCTYSQNQANRGLNKNNTSGFKGVSRDGKKWRAVIMVDNKYIRLSCHDTPEQAARVYDEAAKKYFGEFASLNFQ